MSTKKFGFINEEEVDVKEILNRIPTIFKNPSYSNGNYMHNEQFFAVNYENEIILKISDSDSFRIRGKDVSRFLDNIILKALALGYIYDNKDEPLQNLLSQKANNQIELRQLEKVVDSNLINVKKPVL